MFPKEWHQVNFACEPFGWPTLGISLAPAYTLASSDTKFGRIVLTLAQAGMGRYLIPQAQEYSLSAGRGAELQS